MLYFLFSHTRSKWFINICESCESLIVSAKKYCTSFEYQLQDTSQTDTTDNSSKVFVNIDAISKRTLKIYLKLHPFSNKTYSKFKKWLYGAIPSRK